MLSHVKYCGPEWHCEDLIFVVLYFYIDQFWRKRCEKSVKLWTTNFYKGFSKIFSCTVHALSLVKNSFGTYVCYTPDGFLKKNI